MAKKNRKKSRKVLQKLGKWTQLEDGTLVLEGTEWSIEIRWDYDYVMYRNIVHGTKSVGSAYTVQEALAFIKEWERDTRRSEKHWSDWIDWDS